MTLRSGYIWFSGCLLCNCYQVQSQLYWGWPIGKEPRFGAFLSAWWLYITYHIKLIRYCVTPDWGCYGSGHVIQERKILRVNILIRLWISLNLIFSSVVNDILFQRADFLTGYSFNIYKWVARVVCYFNKHFFIPVLLTEK